jgi:hypothetical protein
MDVALADPIRRTLIAAIMRGDTGYAHDGYRAMNDREAIKVLIEFGSARSGQEPQHRPTTPLAARRRRSHVRIDRLRFRP